MMKSSPAATFVMPRSQFLPEFFVVSLHDPAMLGYFTNSLGGVSDGKVESQYLVGSLSPAGHSISSHSSACGSFLRSSRCAGRTRKPQIESAVSSLFPHAMTPSSTPEVPRIPPIPSRNRLMLPVSTEPRAGAPLPFLLFRGSGDSPGSQMVVRSRTPTTYRKPSSVMPSRKS
jgi:hypothetical protein